jgi:hypothetical protein
MVVCNSFFKGFVMSGIRIVSNELQWKISEK